jgi:hypothetical protein
MGYLIATVSMVTKLACAAAFAHDGDAMAAVVFLVTSPSLFLLAK